MAIETPNYTQYPNEILDNWMSKLTGAEYKVLSKIVRNTFGWKKKKDKISISSLEESTGLGKTQIIKAIKNLEKYDLIECSRNQRRIIEFRIKTESEPEETPLVQKVNQASSESEPPLVQKVNPTKEKVKETKQKKTCAAFNIIKDYFIDKNPNYYHDGKQAKNIKNLENWSRGDTDKVIALCNKHLSIKNKSNSDFWRNSPHTPSSVYSKKDEIVEFNEEKKPQGEIMIDRTPEEQEKLRVQKEKVLNERRGA